jgi:serine protease
VRVLGKCGGFSSDIVAGMLWAAGVSQNPIANPNPANVINMSLGSTGACTQTYQDAINQVVAAGVSVVVSAGNDAGLAVGKPANCAGAIGVGGLRHIGTKVGFSDVGPEIAVSAPGGNCVNLSGTCLFPILTASNSGLTTPNASIFTDGSNPSVGTSFSAPLVAGTLGLMLSANPNLTPAQLKLGVMRTARTFPTTGGAAGVQVCHAPDTNVQDECYCTTSTCGAGMLSAGGATAAAASLKAWIVASDSQVATRGTVSLDGSLSWAASPGSITSRTWTIQSGTAFATLQGASSPTASLTGVSPGTVVVTLTVSDGTSQVSDQTTIQIVDASPGSGGGGGALSWPWLLALGCAVLALRPRRTR